MDVSDWQVDHDVITIGTREKEVLVDPETGRRAFFKIPRAGTAEHWTEKIASELAKTIGFPCQSVEIATYKGIQGALCYSFLGSDEELTHGSELLFGAYESSRARDLRLHTIKNIRAYLSSPPYNLFEDFLIIPVFDALIGNTDRHSGNWGIIYNVRSKSYSMSPLFDNSSSLGWQYIDSEHIRRKLGSPIQWDNFINKKCLSAIRWTGDKINHFDLIKILIAEFPFLRNIISKLCVLSNNVIESIVDGIDDGSMPPPFRRLTMRIIKERRDTLLRIAGV